MNSWGTAFTSEFRDDLIVVSLKNVYKEPAKLNRCNTFLFIIDLPKISAIFKKKINNFVSNNTVRIHCILNKYTGLKSEL